MQPRNSRHYTPVRARGTATLGCIAALIGLCAAPVLAETQRVSLTDTGGEANDHSTTSLYGLSSDSEADVCVFSSFATNLVPNDVNNASDVFVRDMANGRTELISRSILEGTGHGASYHPAISRDGRWVTFASLADDLVPDDTNGFVDVFLFDRQTETMIRVSEAGPGLGGNGYSSFPAIASNEECTEVYISFTSSADNLSPADTSGIPDILYYTYYVETGVSTLGLVSQIGGTQGDEASVLSAISANGRFIVYTTYIWNLIPPTQTKPLPPVLGLLVYDHTLQSTYFRLITTPDDGTFPSISGDGRFFAYVEGGKVILYDLLQFKAEVISIASDGGDADQSAGEPTVSADGRFVAFSSGATNLVPGDTNNSEDVFVRDRATRQTVRVSLTHDVRETDGPSRAPSISEDGQHVVFTSSATNIVSDDMNLKEDVFISDFETFQPGSQPDMLIRKDDDTWYVGNDLYSPTGEAQSVTDVAQWGKAAVYHLKVQNDGASPDTFRITGGGGGAGWTVQYFDALTEGNDVSADIIGPGWNVGPLAPGNYQEFRVEVAMEPGVPPQAPHELLVKGTSIADITETDAVKAVTNISTVSSQPDMLIRKADEMWYAGNDVYNDTGSDQSASQTARWDEPSVYHLKVQNDGTATDSFVITGDAGGNGWVVKYYDALTDGVEITGQINDTGWATDPLPPGGSHEFRVEVAADLGVPAGDPIQVLVTAKSAADATKRDTVEAVANPPQPRKFEHEFARGVWMAGIPANPVDPRADVVLGTTQAAMWQSDTQTYLHQYYRSFDLSPGMGVWVNYPNGRVVSFYGYAPAGSIRRDLLRDWNLLANPGTSELPWQDVLLGTTGSVQPYGWTLNEAGTGYALISTLDLANAQQSVHPWQGFWLKANENCQVSLGTVGIAAASEPPDLVAWAVQLAVRAGNVVDEHNYIGVAKSATPVVASNPPALGEGYVDLYVADTAGAGNALSLLGAGEKPAWDLVVETDVPHARVEVAFPDLSAVPADLSLVLQDLDTGQSVNMRTSRGYSFTAGEDGASRHLRVEASPRGAALLITSASAHGTPAGTEVVYALSAAGDVRIEVLNIAGRKVAAIPSGYKAAGTHTARWAGTGLSGSKVPPGQYLISIRCTSDDGTQATRVLPARVR